MISSIYNTYRAQTARRPIHLYIYTYLILFDLILQMLGTALLGKRATKVNTSNNNNKCNFVKKTVDKFSISTDFSNNFVLLSFFFSLLFAVSTHSRLKRNRLQMSKLKVS